MSHKVQKRVRRIDGKRVTSQTYYLRYRYGDMLRDKWLNLGVTTKELATSEAEKFRVEWEAEAKACYCLSRYEKGQMCLFFRI
jgi:hypothetical protein